MKSCNLRLPRIPGVQSRIQSGLSEVLLAATENGGLNPFLGAGIELDAGFPLKSAASHDGACQSLPNP